MKTPRRGAITQGSGKPRWLRHGLRRRLIDTFEFGCKRLEQRLRAPWLAPKTACRGEATRIDNGST
jgi:hypothetical protein